MEKIRLFLAGIGGYGCVYLEEWEKMNDPSVTIEGICEVMPGIEERFPIIKEKSIPVYHSVEDFYKEHEAELAILATPIHLHQPQAVTCLEHGSNVLVEKPLCSTLQEAKELLDKEKETGHFVAVGYQMNYDHGMRALKQDILDGAFGKPILFKTIHTFRRGYEYYHRNNWAGKVSVSSHLVNDSPVNNSNAHQFQSMLFLLGSTMERAAEITDVRAELYRANSDVENYDTAAFEVMTDCKVPVYYYTTHECRQPEFGPVVEFQFEDAVVSVQNVAEKGGERYYVAEWKDGRRKIYGNLIYSQSLQKMYDAIECTRHGGHPVCTVQTAGSHLEVVARLASMPIRNIDPEQLERWDLEKDHMIHIKNLEEVFMECFEKNQLPSEIGVKW